MAAMSPRSKAPVKQATTLASRPASAHAWAGTSIAALARSSRWPASVTSQSRMSATSVRGNSRTSLSTRAARWSGGSRCSAATKAMDSDRWAPASGATGYGSSHAQGSASAGLGTPNRGSRRAAHATSRRRRSPTTRSPPSPVQTPDAGENHRPAAAIRSGPRGCNDSVSGGGGRIDTDRGHAETTGKFETFQITAGDEPECVT